MKIKTVCDKLTDLGWEPKSNNIFVKNGRWIKVWHYSDDPDKIYIMENDWDIWNSNMGLNRLKEILKKGPWLDYFTIINILEYVIKKDLNGTRIFDFDINRIFVEKEKLYSNRYYVPKGDYVISVDYSHDNSIEVYLGKETGRLVNYVKYRLYPFTFKFQEVHSEDWFVYDFLKNIFRDIERRFLLYVRALIFEYNRSD